jgi:hypothetical protein
VGSSSKKPPEPFEVGGVEGGDAGAEFEADAVQAIRVARGEDHVGSLSACSQGRFEPDASAPADHDDGLPCEFRPAAHAFPFAVHRFWYGWKM